MMIWKLHQLKYGCDVTSVLRTCVLSVTTDTYDWEPAWLQVEYVFKGNFT